MDKVKKWMVFFGILGVISSTTWAMDNNEKEEPAEIGQPQVGGAIEGRTEQGTIQKLAIAEEGNPLIKALALSINFENLTEEQLKPILKCVPIIIGFPSGTYEKLYTNNFVVIAKKLICKEIPSKSIIDCLKNGFCGITICKGNDFVELVLKEIQAREQISDLTEKMGDINLEDADCKSEVPDGENTVQMKGNPLIKSLANVIDFDTLPQDQVESILLQVPLVKFVVSGGMGLSEEDEIKIQDLALVSQQDEKAMKISSLKLGLSYSAILFTEERIRELLGQ